MDPLKSASLAACLFASLQVSKSSKRPAIQLATKEASLASHRQPIVSLSLIQLPVAVAVRSDHISLFASLAGSAINYRQIEWPWLSFDNDKFNSNSLQIPKKTMRR